MTVKVTEYDNLVFEWTLKSQSIESNSSVVSWAMKLVAGSSGAIVSNTQKAWTVTVNGNKYTGTATNGINNNQTKTLASGSTTIPHDSDGSKTFSFTFKQVFKGLVFSGQSISDKSGSGSGTLPTIARASQPSCVTWPQHTQNVGNFGSTISIHMNRLHVEFTHKVRYQFGSQSGTIADNVENGTTWTIPLSLMNLIPDSTSGSGTIFVDTYHGEHIDANLVGTKSCGFTATVPSNIIPSCSFTLEDTNGVDKVYGSPVQSLSKIKVKVSATLAYSSPIKSYLINIDGANYTAAEITTDLLRTAGTSRVTATVTDSRGRKGTRTYDMNVQAYTAPSVSLLNVNRCDEDGTENAQGEYVKATFSAAITALKNLNTATYTLRYKKTSATSWTTVNLTDLTKVYTLTNRTYIFAADGNSSYDVEFTATDSHNATTRTTSVSSAFTLMNWGPDGTSMGIGMVAEKENTLGIALTTEHIGDVATLGNRYCFNSPGQENTAGFVLMAQVTVLKNYADVPITFVFTQRKASSPMTVHFRLAPEASTAPALDSITYEGDNYDAYAHQLSASVWGIYVKKGENWDNITLQDWYTSVTMAGEIEVTFPGTLVTSVPEPYYKATPAKLQSLLDYIYPVGSVYISYSHVNPGTLFGGTWTRIQNAFLWAVDGSGTIGQTGGEKEHTLTVNEIPSHSHGSVYSGNVSGTKNYGWFNTTGDKITYGTVPTGGGAAHNNMPPYIQVSVWRRTA